MHGTGLEEARACLAVRGQWKRATSQCLQAMVRAASRHPPATAAAGNVHAHTTKLCVCHPHTCNGLLPALQSLLGDATILSQHTPPANKWKGECVGVSASMYSKHASEH